MEQQLFTSIPRETARKATNAGIRKAAMPWTHLALKSFMGGCFVAFGSLLDLAVQGGLPGIRATNPAISNFAGGLVFPVGMVLVILTECELFNANLVVMTLAAFQRKIPVLAVIRSFIISYILNLAGSLLVAGFGCWWADVLSTTDQQSYAASQAEARVLHSFGTNFLKGIGCNWFVGVATWLSFQSRIDTHTVIYTTWIPVCSFIVLGYQHAIANFTLLSVGLFYNAKFSVGTWIIKGTIPVTLGNAVGGIIFTSMIFWYLYGQPTEAEVVAASSTEKMEAIEAMV